MRASAAGAVIEVTKFHCITLPARIAVVLSTGFVTPVAGATTVPESVYTPLIAVESILPVVEKIEVRDPPAVAATCKSNSVVPEVPAVPLVIHIEVMVILNGTKNSESMSVNGKVNCG